MPRISPARYSQVVCNHRSSAAPINHPATVAAGNTNASWLYLASCTHPFFLSGLSSSLGIEEEPNSRRPGGPLRLKIATQAFLAYQVGHRRGLDDPQRPIHH